MPLCTTAEYKAWRGITVTDWDTVLGVMITTATAEIERLTGRTAGGFESANAPFTEVFDGDGTQTLSVSNGPISSITSISVGNSDPTALDASGYTHDSDREISRIPASFGSGVRTDEWGSLVTAGGSAVFQEGHQNITVVYVAGYTTIPDDLKMICYEFMDHYLESRGRDFEKVSEAVGNANVTVRATADFVERKMAILRPWRRVL